MDRADPTELAEASAEAKAMSRLLVVALLPALALLACSEHAPAPAPPPCSGPDCLGEDPGDWTDTGPFAECDIIGDPCSVLKPIELTRCNLDSLAGLHGEGVYLVQTRQDSTYSKFSPLRVLPTSRVYPGPNDGFRDFTSQDLSAGRFHLAWNKSFEDRSYTATQQTIMEGCEAPSPQELRGCTFYCQNHSLLFIETFRAIRVSQCASASNLSLEAELPTFFTGGPVVSRDHLFVEQLIHSPEGYSSPTLVIYDVTNRSQPLFQGLLQPVPTSRRTLSGLAVAGDALYVSTFDTEGHLHIFDIQDPSHPTLRKTLPLTGPHALFGVGNTLALIPQPLGNGPPPTGALYDLSDPFDPQLTTEFPLAAGSSFFPFEDRLYLPQGGNGLQIAEVREGTLQEIGRYRYPGANTASVAVGRFGERVIAFEAGRGWSAHLRILDVTDPSQVFRIAEYRVGEGVSIADVTLRGTRLYVAYHQKGVRVLDVSTPSAPREVGHYDTYPASPMRCEDTSWADADVGGTSLFEGAVHVVAPGDGHLYVQDSLRKLLILREQ